MSRRKTIALSVTIVLIIAIFVGAEFGKTQKTILTPGMTNQYTTAKPNG